MGWLETVSENAELQIDRCPFSGILSEPIPEFIIMEEPDILKVVRGHRAY